MDKDRAAVEDMNRAKRFNSADSDSAKHLAEVEQAVIASRAELEKEEAEMRSAGKYADAYIDQHMANRRAQSRAYIQRMKQDIVDPIAKSVEEQAQATVFEVPERTAIHVEASAHYAALDSDKRQEAISRAITGKDDVLAVALLTGRDPITDITREQLMKRITPDDDNREQIMSMAKRVQATLNTIGERR